MSKFRSDSIFWVEVEKIVPNPYQPRRAFDEGKLKELADSIRMYGVLQPLTVSRIERELENGGLRTEYELIAGERRLRASKLAGLPQVPVLIREGDESEQEKLELAIIENLQREDLNAVDRALAFKQLADQFNLSHTQVAKKVGRSREYVSNSVRLLGLPQHMLESVKTGELGEGHARTLLMLSERPEEQETVFREILLKKLSVREVERIARKIATDKVRKQNNDTDPIIIAKERELTETLGTRVSIAKTDFGGKITIDYFSEDDLDQLLSILRSSDTLKKSEAVVQAVVAEMSEAGTADDDAFGRLLGATPLSAMDSQEREEENEEMGEEKIEPENALPNDEVKEKESADSQSVEPIVITDSVKETEQGGEAEESQQEPAATAAAPDKGALALRRRLSSFFAPEESKQPATPAQPASKSLTPQGTSQNQSGEKVEKSHSAPTVPKQQPETTSTTTQAPSAPEQEKSTPQTTPTPTETPAPKDESDLYSLRDY